jgi:hypothetical protein
MVLTQRTADGGSPMAAILGRVAGAVGAMRRRLIM